ncbi:hypothetical protein AB0M35_26710 [Micromonospora sp. NPDC051196]|uniref:hypothetical protein n=1 Tax=Micromonospora sp. NPDC051196 TaxID=3155281 RepID=UPI003434812F
MARTYRNTLKAHAHALSSLGAALTDLAHEHRVAASAMEQQPPQGPRGDSDFADWIAAAAEISAAAERLLELEVELARHHGTTWEQVADALGVTRQSAWERFRSHSRWDRTHRLSRLRRVRRAALFRRMAFGQSEDFVAALRQMMRAGHASSERQSPPGA